MKQLLGRGGHNEEKELVPADPQRVDPQTLAAILTERAEGDPQLLEALKGWQAKVNLLQVGGQVSNTVSGEVHGKLVQAQNIGSLRIE